MTVNQDNQEPFKRPRYEIDSTPFEITLVDDSGVPVNRPQITIYVDKNRTIVAVPKN